jgi:hypothetical protein
LVKEFPYTGCIAARMSQEPNQHGQKEHYVDHENSERVGEALVCLCDDAGIHQGIEFGMNLLNLCAHEYSL